MNWPRKCLKTVFFFKDNMFDTGNWKNSDKPTYITQVYIEAKKGLHALFTLLGIVNSLRF